MNIKGPFRMTILQKKNNVRYESVMLVYVEKGRKKKANLLSTCHFFSEIHNCCEQHCTDLGQRPSLLLCTDVES